MIKKTRQIILFMTLILLVTYSIASAEIVDRIVAVVNNDIITLVQLNKAIQPYKLKIEASQTSADQQKAQIENLEKNMLKQLIDRSLTSQEAIKYNVNVTDKDIDQAINNFMKMNQLDQEGLEKGLAAEGILYKDYRLKMKEEILQSMLINRAVRSKVIITESDITTYYDAHKEEFAGIKKYHLKNILMTSETDLKGVEKKLGENTSFAQLAKEYSIGTNAQQGGDLGVFDINSFSENIKQGLLPLGKGEHSPILEIGQGYQILYVEDIILEGNKTIDQANEQIQNILYKEQAEKLFTDWIKSLKKSAHIKIML
jgi:peptidyl-prolyl cis-trans isomerase SurA